MKIQTIEDFAIYESDGHGKTTKGNKKSSGIQVRQYIHDGYLLLATYSYPIGDNIKRNAAIEKARNYIKESI